MKVKHWIFIILVLIGAVYLWHSYSAHGGIAGFKQGLGLR